MMLKTHLVLSLLVVIMFFSHISNKAVFIAVILFATIIPDIDTGFSTAGKNIFFKPLQFFVKHRGIFHSFTFCIIASFIIAYFWPILALPFFLGYGFHLILDSFTKAGIMPFWPWRKTSSWRVTTGSRVETSLFIILIVIDLLMFVLLISQM
ncbi:MAG: metal-dependent hydrolase [Nanoarchaeota archaeon]